MTIGTLYRLERRTGFKIALVTSYPRYSTNVYVYVRLWRANSNQWTNPQKRKSSELRDLTDADHKKHGRTIERALEAREKL